MQGFCFRLGEATDSDFRSRFRNFWGVRAPKSLRSVKKSPTRSILGGGDRERVTTVTDSNLGSSAAIWGD